MTRELRSLIGTAVVAFDTVRTGNVGVGGSTGRVLQRSLLGSLELITRTIDEAHLRSGELDRRPIAVREFIREVGAAVAAVATAHGVTLVVSPVPEGLTIEADRQILAAVTEHLLKNAFKFTRPSTTVTLRVAATPDRVRIEVQDECGGRLGSGEAGASPPSTLLGAARTGLGIGLAFCRSGAQSLGGRMDLRNSGKGCVYTLDLPRLSERAQRSQAAHEQVHH